MGVAKPDLGFGSRTEAVLALRASGVYDAEIAARIGITRACVAALAQSSARERPSRSHEDLPIGMVSVAFDTLRGLRPHAGRRGVSVDALVRTLLQAIVDDGLVDAVLDDR